jgi:hypothetical protein
MGGDSRVPEVFGPGMRMHNRQRNIRERDEGQGRRLPALSRPLYFAPEREFSIDWSHSSSGFAGGGCAIGRPDRCGREACCSTCALMVSRMTPDPQAGWTGVASMQSKNSVEIALTWPPWR